MIDQHSTSLAVWCELQQ